MKKLILLFLAGFMAYSVNAQESLSTRKPDRMRTASAAPVKERTVYVAVEAHSEGEKSTKYEVVRSNDFEKFLDKEDIMLLRRLPEYSEKFTHKIDFMNVMAGNGWKLALSENTKIKDQSIDTYYFEKVISSR